MWVNKHMWTCLFLLVILQSPTPHIWDLTLSQTAATGGPLAQWLTAVALKVWYLLACRYMWPTNLTLSPCWEIDRKSKERGNEKDKNVIVKDDGFRCERGQVSGGFLNHFFPCSPLLPQSPPWLQRVSDRSPCYHSLHCWAALEHCDQAGGSQLKLLLLISLLCYCFCSFFLSVHLLPSLILSQYVSLWLWLKYLQVHGWFNLENVCDSLTSNNSLGNIFLLSFLEFHSLLVCWGLYTLMLQKCILHVFPINVLSFVYC